MVQPLGPEQHLHHPQKQADPDGHHEDREQSPRRPGKRDVAEPGGGRSRDREIKAIDLVADRRGFADAASRKRSRSSQRER